MRELKAVAIVCKGWPVRKSSSVSEPIISVSGLRGIIGEQLTPWVASRYVAALASSLQLTSSAVSPSAVSPSALSLSAGAAVVVGRDGRSSGSMLAQVVNSTLMACGLRVIDIGVAATPTVGIQVRHNAAVAGIQISASHNPRQYNGLKLFGSDGRVLSKATGEQVLAAYRRGEAHWADVDGLGSLQCLDDPHAAHAELVLGTVDVAAIAGRGFRVLLDSNHGAGSLLGRQLLSRLGCHFTLLGDTPDGRFAHPPEPLADNLQAVARQVREGNYDIGFCQDPDADRLAVIDEHGNYIGEELTLALCLLQALPKRPGTVVTNCATSGLSAHIAEQHGSRLLQSAVGEANVADLMIAQQAVFGGEGNGGPIDPQVGYVRDSFVGIARILDLLASRQTPLSQVVAGLPKLAIVKDKIDLDTSRLPQLFDLLTAETPDAQPSRLDGLKLQWPDRWLLVRGSNTEPIVRFIAEAPTADGARALCDQARRLSAKL